MSRGLRSIVESRDRSISVVLRQELEEAEQKGEIYLWVVVVSDLSPSPALDQANSIHTSTPSEAHSTPRTILRRMSALVTMQATRRSEVGLDLL